MSGKNKDSGEPWVLLPGEKELADWSSEDKIAYNQRSRQEEKYRFYRFAFDFLSDNDINGDYMEFGCHRCRTFRMALTEARRHGLEGMRFLAFDSFEGLPKNTEEGGHQEWAAGALHTSEDDFLSMVAEHSIYVDRVETFKGFYDTALTDELAARLNAGGVGASMATIDCDYYYSARPVLNFIEPFLREGTLIYIDDYFAGYRGNPRKGVAQAFEEFRARSAWNFADHMTIGWWGRSFIAYPKDTE